MDLIAQIEVNLINIEMGLKEELGVSNGIMMTA